MTATAHPRRDRRAQRARLPHLPARRVHVQPRRALRPHRVAHRPPRHVGRGLPQGAHARRGLELLLRHRQLRRRDRHDEPLRHRRPVRRPLQRRLPQGRARPPGELRPRADHRPRSRPCSPTGRTTASTPSPPPQETGSAFGEKRGDNLAAVTRTRVTAQRMVGVPGDEPLRTDDTGHPVNRMFADVAQDEPEVEAEPGYEDEVAAFNLFAYLSRSDVTWNPSVVSVCKDSLLLPDHRGVHPADHPRQRPGRVVRPAVRRDPLEGRGPRDRARPGQRGHEGGRRGRHARRHPPPGLLAQAGDAAGLGERVARAARPDRRGQGAERRAVEF